ncbi:MAG TPA: hypothetical protein VLK65_22170 [Vicinamibacteria bacterium]|nr:hypothetical protein [Vicinamibacteria bacterium]
MRTNQRFLFLLLLLAGPAARSMEPRPAPEWVVTNWKNLIGVWIADNSAYKTDDDSMDAFGLEWTWGIGNKSLVGRLYGIRDECDGRLDKALASPPPGGTRRRRASVEPWQIDPIVPR